MFVWVICAADKCQNKTTEYINATRITWQWKQCELTIQYTKGDTNSPSDISTLNAHSTHSYRMTSTANRTTAAAAARKMPVSKNRKSLLVIFFFSTLGGYFLWLRSIFTHWTQTRTRALEDDRLPNINFVFCCSDEKRILHWIFPCIRRRQQRGE